MGNFVNRLSASILESRHLKKADFVVDASAADRFDLVISKIKAGAKTGDLDIMDRAAIETVTKDLVRALPKNADDTPTTRSVIALQKAYSHGILVEFGAGKSAEAAIKTFNDSVVNVIKKENIGAGVSGTAVDTAGLEKMSARNLNNRQIVDGAAEARATERISAQRAAATDFRTVGGDNPHIDSQTALLNAETAQKQIERTESFISGWASGQDNSRNLFVSQMDNLNSPNFATRKSAYNAITATAVTPEGKATDVIGFSGYIARDADGARSVQKYLNSDERLEKLRLLHPEKSDEQIDALKGKPRTIKEIEDIFKTKPGYAWEKVQDKTLTQEQRIEALTKIDARNRITTAEWDAYKSYTRQGFLQLERQDVLNKLDTLRLSRRADIPKAALEEQFTKLREISRDPDYQKAIAEQNGTSVVRLAQDTRDAPKTISARLKDGQPVSEGDINRLEVYYARHFVERAAAAKPEGTNFKDKVLGFFRRDDDNKQPSTADRWSEWNTGHRISMLNPLKHWGKGLVVVGLSATNVYIDPNPYDKDTLDKKGNPTAFSNEKPNFFRQLGVRFLISPLGDFLAPDVDGVKRDAYTSAVEAEMASNPATIPLWRGLSESKVSAAPSVKNAITMYNKTQKSTSDAIKDESSAYLQQGAVDYAKETGTGKVKKLSESGVTSTTREAVLIEQYEAGTISASEMEQLASRMVQAAALQGDANKMSQGEFDLIKEDPVYTSLSPDAQAALNKKLEPSFK